MSRKTEDTEIYRYAHKASMVAIDIVRNMNNSFKATIGDRLLNKSLDLLSLVFDSNEKTEKIQYLDEISRKISKLSVLIRLCSDNKLCSLSAQAQFIENLMLVDDNTSKWKNYLKQKPSGIALT